MSTLTVTKTGRYATCEYTVTYTDTQITISISQNVTISPTSSIQLCRIYVSGTLLYEWYNGTVTTSVLTKTYNKSASASTATLGIAISSSDWGSADNSVTIAIPALQSYAVTYNANGHGTAPSSQTKYQGQALTLRDAITATGYTFKRWNTKNDDTGTGYNAKASYTGNAALSLYAIWNHSITYNANGGSGAPSTQTSLATAAITVSSTAPTRTGYSFGGWNTKADGTGTNYSAGGKLAANAANITLYAKWTENTYTVSYNANGHGTAPSSQTKYYTKTLTLAAAITATGYTFVRWNTNSTNTGTGYNASASYTTNANLSLYAIWNRTVTYNANGGSGAPSSQTALATSAITLSSTKPVRDGYLFLSWNTKSDGTGTSYNPSASYGANNPSMTLYAQWRKEITAITIGTVKAIRTDDNTVETPVESDEGTEIYIKIPFTVTGAAAGIATISATATGESVTTSPASISKVEDTTLSGTFIITASNCDIDVRYTFDITITCTNTTYSSQVAKTASRVIIVPTAFFTVDFLAGGKGVHFGGPATASGFWVSMKSYFTDTISMHNNDITIGTVPSSSYYGKAVVFEDSNGTDFGVVRGNYYNNGMTAIQIFAQRYVNGTTKTNTITLRLDDSGNATVAIDGTGAAASWRSAIGAYSSGGGWATGDIGVTKSYDAHFKCLATGVSTRFNATAPSANRTIGSWQHLDSNSSNNVVAYSETLYTTDKQQYTSFITRRFSADGSSNTPHGFYLRIDNDGTVRTTFPTNASRDAWMSGLNALSKSGGAITGSIFYDSSTLDASKTNNNISSDVYPTMCCLRDKEQRILGRLEFPIKTSGTVGSYWYVRNYNTSGTQVAQKGISMIMNKSGTLTYVVGDPANFRSAISALGTGGGTMTGKLITTGGIAATAGLTSCGTNMPFFIGLAQAYGDGGNFGYVTKANMCTAIGAQAAGSSSIRYKHDIKLLSDELLNAHRLYELPVKQFVFNDDFDRLQYADMKGQTLPGFIAEDIAEIYPSAVIHKDGEIESWDERRIIPAMLKLIQEQHEEIEKLKQHI